MRNAAVTILTIFFIMGFGVSTGWCDFPVTGEILNINPQYQIVFTDVGNPDLEDGDIVKIIRDGKLLTHLQVLRASTAISKLGPITDDKTYQTSIDFKDLSVGDIVEKIPSVKVASFSETKPSLQPLRPSSSSVSSSVSQSPRDVYDYEPSCDQLSDDLTEIIEQKRVLQQKVDTAQTELSECRYDLARTQRDVRYLKETLDNVPPTSACDCSSEKATIQELEKRIDVLKEKLNRIITIVERKLTDHE